MSIDDPGTLSKIMAFFEARGQGEGPKLTTDLVDGAHLDSLELAAFLIHLESQFNIDIPESEVTPDNFGTIEHVIAFLETKSQ